MCGGGGDLREDVNHGNLAVRRISLFNSQFTFPVAAELRSEILFHLSALCVGARALAAPSPLSSEVRDLAAAGLPRGFVPV